MQFQEAAPEKHICKRTPRGKEFLPSRATVCDTESMWPVIVRELRAGSRRWTNYMLRLAAASATLLALLFYVAEGDSSWGPSTGSDVFAIIHRIIFIAIWILVPLMTCDCISQERREGTLGLLFLTNLRARQIISAKVTVHVLRALTLWLATVPVVVVPLLLGGLQWVEIVLSLGFTLGAVGCAVLAGVTASVISKNWGKAALLSLCLSGLLLIMHGATIGFAINETSRFLTLQPTSDDIFDSGLAVAFGIDGLWSEVVSIGVRGLVQTIVGAAFVVALLSWLLLLFSIAIAARFLRRNWQDKPKSRTQTEMEELFCKPLFWKDYFRQWMRRSLDHNPIGWLEKRTWAGRIGSWIWLGVMTSFASMFMSYTPLFARGGIGMLSVLMWMLLLSLAYVAAGSFRRERETGALELIVVTPLREWEIIQGRLRALWTQFLPACLVWLAIVIYLGSALQGTALDPETEWWQLADLVAAYFAIPVVGLYFSLRSRIVLLAWLATVALTIALPRFIWWFTSYVMASFYWPFNSDAPLSLVTSELITVPAQVAIAGILLWRLQLHLARRTFAFR